MPPPKPLPEVTAEPAPPVVVPQQVFTRRPVYRCPHCGSPKVKNNGVHPPVAYFECGRCTDDEGAALTFKLPVA